MQLHLLWSFKFHWFICMALFYLSAEILVCVWGVGWGGVGRVGGWLKGGGDEEYCNIISHHHRQKTCVRSRNHIVPVLRVTRNVVCESLSRSKPIICFQHKLTRLFRGEWSLDYAKSQPATLDITTKSVSNKSIFPHRALSFGTHFTKFLLKHEKILCKDTCRFYVESYDQVVILRMPQLTIFHLVGSFWCDITAQRIKKKLRLWVNWYNGSGTIHSDITALGLHDFSSVYRFIWGISPKQP